MCEILSPAGGFEQLSAALESGCDAVYVGAGFSARRNAKNFTRKELADAVYECHRRGVKIYQAINTVFFDDERSSAKEELRYAAEIGIDAIIIQDIGLIRIAKECCPDMPLHASTQMTVHTLAGAIEAKRMGLKRVVLSRECSLETVKSICAAGIETEVFVHGALCMSVSGQCYLSAAIGGRSANRGFCAGACRLPFSAFSKADGEYALSLKDLCAFESLNTLKEAGVASFKIEGRMKRPEYVAAATAECVRALKHGEWDETMLRTVFSRSGFTNGYLNDMPGKDMFGFRRREDSENVKEAYGKIHENISDGYKRSGVRFSAIIKENQKIKITAADSDGVSVGVTSQDSPQKAKNRATDRDMIIKQLKKLGGTQYSFEDADIKLDDGLFVSAAEINDLRREAISGLDKKRYEKNTVIKAFSEPGERLDSEDKPKNPKSVRIVAEKAYQAHDWKILNAELICLPPSEVLTGNADNIPTDKLCLVLDRFMTAPYEEKLKSCIREAYAKGIRHFLLQNLAHFEMLKPLKEKDEKIYLHTFFGFNITNSDALCAIKEMGADDAAISLELSERRISRLSHSLPTGAVVYGHLPLMLMRNCPVKAQAGCENCTGALVDRMGKKFFINCKKKSGYYELLNGDPLYLADKEELKTDIDYIMFTKETAEQAANVLLAYKKKTPPTGDFTRGLYYRKLF